MTVFATLERKETGSFSNLSKHFWQQKSIFTGTAIRPSAGLPFTGQAVLTESQRAEVKVRIKAAVMKEMIFMVVCRQGLCPLTIKPLPLLISLSTAYTASNPVLQECACGLIVPDTHQGFATKIVRWSPVSVSKIITRPSRVPTASRVSQHAQEEIVGASAPVSDTTLNS